MKWLTIFAFLCVSLLKVIIFAQDDQTYYKIYDVTYEGPSIINISSPQHYLENVNVEKGTATVKVNVNWMRNSQFYCIKLNLDHIDFKAKNFDIGEYITINPKTDIFNQHCETRKFLHLGRLEYITTNGDTREYALYTIERLKNSTTVIYLQFWIANTMIPACNYLIISLKQQDAIIANKCLVPKPKILKDSQIVLIMVGFLILAPMIIIGVYQVRVVVEKIMTRNIIVPMK